MGINDDGREHEGLPPGPFQAPEFKRGPEVGDDVAARFEKWRQSHDDNAKKIAERALNRGLPWETK